MENRINLSNKMNLISILMKLNFLSLATTINLALILGLEAKENTKEKTQDDKDIEEFSNILETNIVEDVKNNKIKNKTEILEANTKYKEVINFSAFCSK